MSIEASSHATAELLSAYLDRQLREGEAGRLEAHLEHCEECHVRLEGLRRVVANLHRLESLEPPAELEKAVARRVALAGDRLSVLDRVENRLSIFNRQSPILPMFGVVLALGVFIYLFAVALERSRSSLTEVVFVDSVGEAPAAGESRQIAGRVLDRVALAEGGEVWLEEGVSREAVSRTVELDSAAGDRLAAEHPELRELADLGAPAVIELAGEVVEIR
jgi:anti-sigma factor RsiW